MKKNAKKNKKSVKYADIEIIRIENRKVATKKYTWKKKELTPIQKQTDCWLLGVIKSIFNCKSCNSLADDNNEIILT